jgi:hypothetical protein
MNDLLKFLVYNIEWVNDKVTPTHFSPIFLQEKV